MNVNLYMFGCLKNRYEQYPQDSTQPIFLQMVKRHREKRQFFISRQGNMMFYAYIHPLPPRRFLFWKRRRFCGFGMQVNGMALNDLPAVIREFESAINMAATSGRILMYDENGQIGPDTRSIYLDQEEVINLLGHLSKNGHLERSIFEIPELPYDMAPDSITYFTDKDPFDHIVKVSTNYGFTIIDLVAKEEENKQNAKHFQELLELSKHTPDIHAQDKKH